MATKVLPSQQNIPPTGCNKSRAKTIKAHGGRVMLKMGSATCSSRSSSTSTSSPQDTQSRLLAIGSPLIIKSGLIGCAAGAAALLVIIVWYDFTGARAALEFAKAARLTLDKRISDRLKKMGTYNLDEALETLERTTLAYAIEIPGGSARIQKAFSKVKILRKAGAAQVEEIVAATYEELSMAGKRKATVEQMKEITVKNLLLLSGLPNKVLRGMGEPHSKLVGLRTLPEPRVRSPPKLQIRSKQAIAA